MKLYRSLMAQKRVYLYGRHPIIEALRSGSVEIKSLFLSGADRTGPLSEILSEAKRHNITVQQVSKKKLQDLVGQVTHQGVVGEVAPFRYANSEDILERATERGEPALIVALDHIQDPHNLGAIIRSAYALGAHGLIMPRDRSAEITPTVVKSSAGATAHLPIAQVTNLRRTLGQLKDEGLWVLGTSGNAKTSPSEADLRVPTVIVIGSEGTGLKRLISESCDILAKIPMSGDFESLNASVAAGIFLYEAARQRMAID